MKPMQTQPLFLISSGRCGSTFFSNAINTHPRLVSVSELFEPVLPVPYLNNENLISGSDFLKMLTAQTMIERVKIWLSDKTHECLYMPQDKEAISLLLCYALPLLTEDPEALLRQLGGKILKFSPDTAANHFLNFCELIKQYAGKEKWIERTGGSLPHTREILYCWPKAKLVHFYRDGRQTACSMRAHPIFRMFVMKRMGMEWNPDFIPPLEAFGQMWSEWVTEAVDAMNELNADVLPIRYEDLMTEPEAVLEQFLRYVFEDEPLKDSDYAWIEKVATDISPAKDHVSALGMEELEKLDSACREGMVALGYESRTV